MLNDIKKTIKSIGIPKGLLFFRYGVFWESFFRNCGFDVVIDEDTTKAVLEVGDHYSVDEVCLASKVYMGHVAELIDKCDAIFVPSFESCHPRCGFCTKFQSLPDMIRNTFRDQNIQTVSLDIKDVTNERKTRQAYIELAESLGVSAKIAKRAYKRAISEYKQSLSQKDKELSETLKLVKKYKDVLKKDKSQTQEDPLTILIVAHPYIAHDPFMIDDLIKLIKESNAIPIFADEYNRQKALKRSFEFSETLPWLINRELAGSLLELKDDIDGVITVSAFPCGPDSMFVDSIVRKIKDMPILTLMIDAQNGSAGVQTRVESFIDILKFKGTGGYLG